MDWHGLFIILHATAATICLVTGLFVVWPRFVRTYPWLFHIFFVSLIALVVFMLAATASHWIDLDTAARLSFSGLGALGVYMVYRGVSAKRNLAPGKKSENYINDIGFILISLLVGLVIVPLIRLEAPVWLAIAIISLIIISGNRLIKFTHNRLAK